MKYLSWQEKNILGPDGNTPSEKTISDMYEQGFVFTRVAKGVMQQTRAVRIDLKKFELSSENRRILKKITPGKNDRISVIFTGVSAKETSLPLAPADYHWSIAKLAKDFYARKFGDGIMSASKIKEMLTDGAKSNFNTLLTFSANETNSGYSICYKNSKLLHYSYPFYDLSPEAALPKDIGLGMMILAVEHAQKAGLHYIYLGSLQRSSDTYKLQFKGLEWFDGGPEGKGSWETDLEKAKILLKKAD